MNRVLSRVLVFIVIVSVLVPATAGIERGNPPSGKIDQMFESKLLNAAPDERFIALAVFTDRPEVDSVPDDKLPPVADIYTQSVATTAGVRFRWVDELSNAVSFEASYDAVLSVARFGFVREVLEVPVEQVLASHNYGYLDTEISAIDVKPLHDAGYDGSGKRVAVLDTGARMTHVALSSKNINLIWQDFVNGQASPYDDNGHGTSTAALAVGNDPGHWCVIYWCRPPYKGSAFAADLMALKVLNAAGNGAMDDYNEAVQFAVQNGADVISVSLGWRNGIVKNGRSTAAIWTGWAVSAWGVPVVVAGGNEGVNLDGGSAIRTPGDNFNALTVGATTEDGLGIWNTGPWSASSNGPTADGRLKPDVVAPGQNVHIACNTSDTCYASGAGTSFATPLVAGAVASILEKKSWLSPAEIKALLRQTAIDGGAVGPDNVWGHGRIQANTASNAVPNMALSWDDVFTVETTFSRYTVWDYGYLSVRSMKAHGTTMIGAIDVPWAEAGGSGWIPLDNSIIFAGPYISEVTATTLTLTTVYDPGCIRMTLVVQLIELTSSRVELRTRLDAVVCDQFSLTINARMFVDFNLYASSNDYFERMSDGYDYQTEVRIQGTNLRVKDTSRSEFAEIYYRSSDNNPFEWLLRYPGNRDNPDSALTGESIYAQNIVFEYQSRRGSAHTASIGPTIYLNT